MLEQSRDRCACRRTSPRRWSRVKSSPRSSWWMGSPTPASVREEQERTRHRARRDGSDRSRGRACRPTETCPTSTHVRAGSPASDRAFRSQQAGVTPWVYPQELPVIFCARNNVPGELHPGFFWALGKIKNNISLAEIGHFTLTKSLVVLVLWCHLTRPERTRWLARTPGSQGGGGVRAGVPVEVASIPVGRATHGERRARALEVRAAIGRQSTLDRLARRHLRSRR